MPIQCEVRNGIGVVICDTVSINGGGYLEAIALFDAWLLDVPEVRSVVVELGAVTYMDTTGGVGTLILMAKRLHERGGEVLLARPRPAIRLILEITRLNTFFRVCNSVDEALTLAAAPKPPQPEPAPPVKPPAPLLSPAKPPTEESARQLKPPTPEEFRLACELRDGIWVLTPSCALEAGIRDSFRQQFNVWLASAPGVKHLVLDCAAVDRIDSSGESLLILPVKQLKR